MPTSTNADRVRKPHTPGRSRHTSARTSEYSCDALKTSGLIQALNHPPSAPPTASHT